MDRFNMYPSFHYEENTNGIIENPALQHMRSYTIYGNTSKNLITTYQYPSTTNGITFTVNDDGTISVSGTNTGSSYAIYSIFYSRKNLIPGVKVGDTITFSVSEIIPNNIHINVNGINNSGKQVAGLTISHNLYNLSRSCTITDNWIGMVIGIYVKSGATVDAIIKPRLEILMGEKTKYGKNVLTYPYEETTKTLNGITFTDNGDGTITADGTATDNTTFIIKSNTTFTLDKGLYSISGCPNEDVNYNLTATVKNLETDVITVSDMGYTCYMNLNDLSEYTGIDFNIFIKKDAVVDNVIFSPQITSISKNLFNLQKVNAVNKTLNSFDVISSDGKKYDATSYILNYKALLDKSLTLSGEFTNSGYNNGSVSIYFRNENYVALYPILVVKPTLNDRYFSYTFTIDSSKIPENTDHVAFLFYTNNASDKAKAGDYTRFRNIQLELSNKVTPYEPYLTDTYQIDANIVSKNLFDISKVTSFVDVDYTTSKNTYTTISDGVITSKIGLYASAAVWKDTKIKLPAGTYTLSADCMADKDTGNKNVAVYVYNFTLGKIQGRSHILSTYRTWERLSSEIVLEEESEVAVLIQGEGTQDDHTDLQIKIKNVQLEAGDKMTDYAEYESKQIKLYSINQLGPSDSMTIFNTDYDPIKLYKNNTMIQYTQSIKPSKTTYQYYKY